MITLRNVCKSFDGGQTQVVSDLNLEIATGELVALLGESGCGKTTTLKMINRLIEPTSGSIEIDGEDITHGDPIELRRKIGYVFQRIGLFPHMTIADNIGVVPRLCGWEVAQIAERVDELLSLVNLEPAEYRDRRPAELSGGQQQRVGVARALAARPNIVLMDEPFGALDPLTRDVLQEEYKKIHRELELSSVLVTHDMVEALVMADRIAVMAHGRIVQTGTPKELLTAPSHDYVRELMGMPVQQARFIDDLIEAAEDRS